MAPSRNLTLHNIFHIIAYTTYPVNQSSTEQLSVFVTALSVPVIDTQTVSRYNRLRKRPLS
ncbi:hypothetical protein BACCAP_01069 [Pseudoflavonifractor capillosus ATCC 29799]|uniref:Uncharacterized protein n=1 Tax=Pseudoflavonifractor capillosus ATCC 29799 TaxID=411467 RepID=A6NS90_9FIRM|nr:hypothetical protein BACCAP_01069 [Pseudoflavonifractor capillosus ATCC 29799]